MLLGLHDQFPATAEPGAGGGWGGWGAGAGGGGGFRSNASLAAYVTNLRSRQRSFISSILGSA